MGRFAEAEGEAGIWQDLRMKLFVNPAAAGNLRDRLLRSGATRRVHERTCHPGE
jgi:hypothetical protein